MEDQHLLKGMVTDFYVQLYTKEHYQLLAMSARKFPQILDEDIGSLNRIVSSKEVK